jgi:hypothetical protein
LALAEPLRHPGRQRRSRTRDSVGRRALTDDLIAGCGGQGGGRRAAHRYYDEIGLAAGFDTQNAEAVLGVVECDAVDQPSQDFGRCACSWGFRHQVMMENTVLGRYRDQATAVRNATRPYRVLFREGISGEPSQIYVSFPRPPSLASKIRPAESLRRENLSKPLDRIQHLLLRQTLATGSA